nr:aldo/keto reductase [Phaeobacter sp. J2-8]
MRKGECPVAFGCSSLGGLYAPMDDDTAQDLLQAAWDAGLRYFDTAPHYGNGMSEHRLGHFLKGRDGYVISTKVGRVLTPSSAPQVPVNGFHSPLPFDQHFDYSYDGIMRSVEGSLGRLGLDHVDILYVHDIGDPNVGTDTPGHMAALTDGGHLALSKLKAEGVTRQIGLGVNTVSACETLIGRMELDTILLAGRYTLLDQTAALGLLPMCRANEIRIVIGGVFNSGILATGPVEGAMYDYAPASKNVLDHVQALLDICAKHNVPLAAAALQFPGRHDLIVSTLIGTSKPASLQRNLALLNTPLPAALWDDLAKLASQAKELP